MYNIRARIWYWCELRFIYQIREKTEYNILTSDLRARACAAGCAPLEFEGRTVCEHRM